MCKLLAHLHICTSAHYYKAHEKKSSFSSPAYSSASSPVPNDLAGVDTANQTMDKVVVDGECG
jgi:hypothetical protein